MNSQRQLYLRDLVIYYGYPSNSLWSDAEHCPQISPQILIMFCRRVDIFIKNWLISSFLIITMIGSFSSSAGSAVGLDVFKNILGHFKSLTRTMMSSGFYNTIGMYCFRFLVNFLYWSLDSLCYYMLNIIYIILYILYIVYTIYYLICINIYYLLYILYYPFIIIYYMIYNI